MLASMFISGGINSLRHSDQLAERAAPVTEKLEPVANMATQSLPFNLNSQQLVQLNGAVHVVGGLLLATGRVPRLSALALAATLVPTTLAGHRFWEEHDSQQRANQQVHFFKNVSMIGGLLLASVDTEGKPSLAWLAKQSAGRAKRQAAKQASKLTPS